MKRYTARFHGRRRNAIGEFYFIKSSTEAETVEEAEENLREKFEINYFFHLGKA